MFIIDDKLISTELFSRKFMCNLSKCKGACCWEGDFGAPVTDQEVIQIKKIMPKIVPYLSKKSKRVIDQKGIVQYNEYCKMEVTPLHDDGACVYLSKDNNGVARCIFEQLFEAGETTFKKPISCHLYPVRETRKKEVNFEALNYDEWKICSAACSLGEEKQMPVFRFVKEALIRRYGQEFYDQMEDIYATYFN